VSGQPGNTGILTNRLNAQIDLRADSAVEPDLCLARGPALFQSRVVQESISVVLLGKQRVLKLKKPVNYVSLLNLDRTTTELVERIEPVNGFKPRLKVALGFTNWAYRLQICHCNRRTEWPNSDHSGSGKGNVHQRGASDPRSPWQRAYVERRVGTIRRAGSPAND